MEKKPSVGRIVHYRLSKEDAVAINRRRTTGGEIADRIKQDRWPLGAQAHIGNHESAGEVLPLVITRVWPDEYGPGVPGVNGQVILDGNDQLWVTSAKEGTEPGQWSWPPLVAWLLALAAFAIPGVAWAQAADVESLDGVLALLVKGIQGGNWGLLAAAGVTLLTLLFRKWLAPQFSQQWPWLLDKRVVIAVALGGSVAGAILTALAGGVPITVGLVLSALMTGLTGIGLFSAQKNWREAGQPQPAGTALSAVVDRQPGEPMRGPNP